jgi:putative DNA-invertase from lambdoid prophage Rac
LGTTAEVGEDVRKMDALYFRISSDRQTTENQFEEVLQIAELDGSDRDWQEIRYLLSGCVEAEDRNGAGGIRTIYRVVPAVAAELSESGVYVEQGRSSEMGAKRRSLFRQMKRDAAARKFDRLLVWKVSRLGRDMREVIGRVYELADLGVTVVPIKSQTGPINSRMGKLLWAVEAWYAEMEIGKRSESIRAGQARARAGGKHIGRPKRILDRQQVITLRDQEGLSWPEIARRVGAGVGTVVRAYRGLTGVPQPFQNSPGHGTQSRNAPSILPSSLPSYMASIRSWMRRCSRWSLAIASSWCFRSSVWLSRSA